MTQHEPDLTIFMQAFTSVFRLHILQSKTNRQRGDYRLMELHWAEGARVFWLRNERLGSDRFSFRWDERRAILEVWSSPFGGATQTRFTDRDDVSVVEGRLLGYY